MCNPSAKKHPRSDQQQKSASSAPRQSEVKNAWYPVHIVDKRNDAKPSTVGQPPSSFISEDMTNVTRNVLNKSLNQQAISSSEIKVSSDALKVLVDIPQQPVAPVALPTASAPLTPNVPTDVVDASAPVDTSDITTAPEVEMTDPVYIDDKVSPAMTAPEYPDFVMVVSTLVPGSVDTSPSLQNTQLPDWDMSTLVPGSVDTSPSLQKTQLPDWDSVLTQSQAVSTQSQAVSTLVPVPRRTMSSVITRAMSERSVQDACHVGFWESYNRHMTKKYRDNTPHPELEPKAWVTTAGQPRNGRLYRFGDSLDTALVISSC
ncbi:hypothetical protein Taro_021504, partial [Colocasia esculenta]|nr:hypothetical protein [Colocasia esculenta]